MGYWTWRRRFDYLARISRAMFFSNANAKSFVIALSPHALLPLGFGAIAMTGGYRFYLFTK